jgi:organic radical activating enzyme
VRVEIPHVDVMVGDACQLRCIGCTNSMGALPQTLETVPDILAWCEQAAQVMHAGTVCLLGGEPTSHPRLVDIMRGVQGFDLGDRTQILTHGMRLHRMRPDFWTELDWLKISIYPGRTPPENITLARDRAAEHGFDLDFYDVAKDPFRAVLTDRARSRRETQQVYDSCWYRTYTRKIERGHFYRCCTSPSISQVVLGLPPDADGIPLSGLTTATLRDFLSQPTPAHACTRCFGHTGPRIAVWGEERGGKDAWLAKSAYPIPVEA